MNCRMILEWGMWIVERKVDAQCFAYLLVLEEEDYCRMILEWGDDCRILELVIYLS